VYKGQLEKARSPSEKQRIKQKCMNLLKQKKMYEQHNDSLYTQQMVLHFNI
jgi:NAD+--asparagine ADP-ribosyltransferase